MLLINYCKNLDKLIEEKFSSTVSMLDFVECAKCRAKAGHPILCRGCIANRDTINKLKNSLLDSIRQRRSQKGKQDGDSKICGPPSLAGLKVERVGNTVRDAVGDSTDPTSSGDVCRDTPLSEFALEKRVPLDGTESTLDAIEALREDDDRQWRNFEWIKHRDAELVAAITSVRNLAEKLDAYREVDEPTIKHRLDKLQKQIDTLVDWALKNTEADKLLVNKLQKQIDTLVAWALKNNEADQLLAEICGKEGEEYS